MLNQAVREERFHDAKALKNQLDTLHNQNMKVLEHKVMDEASKLRNTFNEELRRDKHKRLENELRLHVALEDFEKANEIKIALQQEEEKRKNSNTLSSAIWKRLDNVWLDSQLHNRIAQAKIKEQEHELQKAIIAEEFENAAQILEELKKETHTREVERMFFELRRGIVLHNSELERLAHDPAKLVEYKMKNAVNAEEFEKADALKKELVGHEIKKMYHSLYTRIKEEIKKDYGKAKEIFDRMITADEKKRLEVQIARAAESNRWKSVSDLRARLVRLYVNSISRPILTTLGVSFRPPRFRIGDTVKHKGLGYRGVVIGWDDKCLATEYWIKHYKIDQLSKGRTQRFYHILPDTRDVSLIQQHHEQLWIADCCPAFLCGESADDRSPFMQTGYIAEECLGFHDCKEEVGLLSSLLNPFRSLKSTSPIKHPLIPHYFFSFRNGRFRSNSRLRQLFFYHMPEWLQDGRPDDSGKKYHGYDIS
ncbi:hypothetical protein GUITHDRAFT_165416 [Guillardia theta CCMP2712]|uniref:Hemimethylated DNA-binding domain-containing protein n=1 Tax=Guillardia theta (strain CCMP2712) TaxID=905079 RepID=L1IN23_GUITC|nr:hypothetical protein GUITHDRAFT_165416 [Guillardia theta CCMP2712]EKX37686.1 hypothetical protein GUITHDRAFT_165416 [Guillardia theta CCMP2712]|eukprot:XP_005824666.1 hypothetical protein GUITHDRAFT_165416 [Guillardia theta CCMP2712]